MWIWDWHRGKKCVMILGAYHVSSVIYVFNTATPLTLSTMEPQMQLMAGFSPAHKREMGDNRRCLLIPILSLSNPHQSDPSLLKKSEFSKMHILSKLKNKNKSHRGNFFVVVVVNNSLSCRIHQINSFIVSPWTGKMLTWHVQNCIPSFFNLFLNSM